MKETLRTNASNLGFAACTLVLSGLFWFEASKLRPSPYDPLGAGAFPKIVSILLAVLALILIGRVLLGRDIGDSDTALISGFDGVETAHRQRPFLAIGVVGALVVYIAVLSFTHIGFLWVTSVFVALVGFAMSSRHPRDAVVAAVVGIGIGVTLNLVFSRILVVALP